MKQIGGEGSNLFSLTATEMAEFRSRISAGQFSEPIQVLPDGGFGALVRFRSVDEAMMVKLAIV